MRVLSLIAVILLAGHPASAAIQRLSVSSSGLGRVVSSPAGISCGTDCSEDLAAGTAVTLTVEPAPGHSFTGWGGACSGTATTCTVTMESPLSVNAAFAGPTVGTLVPAVDRVDMVYDGRRDVMYVSNGSTVLRYRVATGTFLEPFTFGVPLGGIDLSPDGTRLAVAVRDSNSVRLIDLRTEEVEQVTFAPSTGENALFTVAFDGVGALYTASDRWTPVRRYEPATGSTDDIFDAGGKTMLAASGDGTVIAFAEANLSSGPWGRYRVADGDLVRRSGSLDGGTNNFNYEVGVNRDASQYAIPTFAGTYVYNGAYQQTATIGASGGARPIGVGYHPVENAIYFPFANTSVVRLYDSVSLLQIGEYDFGYTFGNPGVNAFRWGRTRLSRDGSLLLVTVDGGVRILRMYDPLAASGQSLTTPSDTPLPVTLTGSIGNGGALAYRIVSAPSHGVLSGAAPNLTYAPGPGFVGQDSFTFVAAYGLAETLPQLVAIGVGEAVQPRISVGKIGAGAGTVASTPAGISCGSLCSAGYPSGTSVTLVAQAGEGSYFWGWSGACSGGGDCAVTVDQHVTVTARFETEPLLRTLSVSTVGLGTVSSSPAGVFCGPICSERFEPGTVVTLTAAPGPGYGFAGWGGACSGTATTCTVTMESALSVTATFAGAIVGTLVPAVDRVDMVYDDRRDVMYVSSGSSVLRYQVATGTFLEPFALGGTLGGIDLSPDGTRLAVAAKDTVSVWLVDLVTEAAEQVSFTPESGELGLFTVAFDRDGMLYATSGSSWHPLRKYDPTTGTVSAVGDLEADTMLAASGDGTVIAFAESEGGGGRWGRYRVADGDLIQRPGAGSPIYEIGVSRDANQYAIPTGYGAYIYDGAFARIRTLGIADGSRPIGVGYHPVENAIYFPFSNTSAVRVYDSASLVQIGEYDFGYTFDGPGNAAFRWGRTRLSRDGSLLMVTVAGGVRILRMYDALAATGQSLTTPSDTPLPVTLTGSVGNGGALAYRIVSAPSHGVLSGAAPNLTYTPGPGFVGQDSFTFVAAYGLAETLPRLVAIGVGEAVQPRISVGKIGAGAGTVASTPAGISCGSLCSAGYPSGTSVTLVAQAGEGSYFWDWSGACSGGGDCTVTVDQHVTVTARFETEPLLHTLSVSTVGLGTVSSSPAGVFCGPICSERFEPGTDVTLTAAPGPGYGFAGWGGACSGTATTCTLTMESALSVTAAFTEATVGTLVPAADRVDMVYDGRRDVMYISSGSSVLRYQVATGTFLEPFALGGTLGGIDLSPDGTRLAVAAKDTVSVWLVDLVTEAAEQVSFTPESSELGLFTVAFDRDGTLYTTSECYSSQSVVLRKYDPASRAVSILLTSHSNTMLAASGDGTVIAFAESDIDDGAWGRYRVVDGDLIRHQWTQGTGRTNYEIGVNRDATQYAIPTHGGTYIYDAAHVKIRAIGAYAGPRPIGLAYHPVENAIYFPFANTSVVRVYDSASLVQTGEYDFGYTFDNPGVEAFLWGRTRLSRDGSLLMVTVGGGVRILRLYDALAASGQSLTTPSDTPLPLTLTGSIGNGGALAYRIVSAPSHGVLSGTAPNLTYTPGPGFAGQDSFTFVAAYGLAETSPRLVTITVAPVYELTVARAGNGTGTVTSTPRGIECGATCSAVFPEGVVTLSATADAGSAFAGWSGEGCAGIGECVVMMNAVRSVTATFDSVPPSVTIDDVAVSEGSGGTTLATFTVSLSHPSASAVTVDFATGGSSSAAAGGRMMALGAEARRIAQLATAPVAWTAAVGVTAKANNLTKERTTGWNAGAISMQQLAAGDGFVELTASETDRYRVFGLSDANPGTTRREIRFGISLGSGGIATVYENGIARNRLGTYASGDTFRIQVSGGVVFYLRNGVVCHASVFSGDYPLAVDTALYTEGATLGGVIVGGDWR